MSRTLASALVLSLLAGAAQAHVMLQPATARPGADETLRFVVGHGCSGQPTTALRVELPVEVKAAAPQAKPGWTLSVEPRAITWRGELAARQSDDFQIKARLPAREGSLAFAVVQSCGDVTVRWDDPVNPGAAKPAHPTPSLILTKAGPAADPAPAAAGKVPTDVRVTEGGLTDVAGKPLYIYVNDTMVGMSHCFDDCAEMWPPLKASAGAKPFGDWALIKREDGSIQWTYKTKPLYTYSKDQPGQPPKGLEAPNWRLAR